LIAEQGRIVALEANAAWVEAASRRDCARCAAGKGCGGGLLGRWLGNRLHHIRAHNPYGLPVDSWVELALDERKLLLAACLMYLPPLLGLLLGASLAGALLGLAEWVVILSGLGGFVIGLLPARLLSGRQRGASLAMPTITRRLAGPPSDCPTAGRVSA
jgi:sigma-E factor negative regulatory protein RseC